MARRILLGHITPEEIVQIIQAVTPLVVAIGTVFSGISAWKAHRGNETTKKVAAVIESKVDDVHACLAEAREETKTGINGVKQQAEEVAMAVQQRESSSAERVSRD